jgi:glyoxylase I family protein
MSLRIHHLALRARDPGVTERFYVSVIGLRVRSRDDARGSVWLDAGGAVVMLERAEGGEPPIPAETKELVAFAIDDLAAWRRRLAEASVAIEAETPHTLYVRDPDGRRVGLSTYVFVGP